MTGTRICYRCKQSRATSEFEKKHGRKPNYSYCTQCRKELRLASWEKGKAGEQAAHKQWAQANQEKMREYGRRSREKNRVSKRLADRKCKLRRMYGITEEDFERLCAEQEGKCAICKKFYGVGLHIDHCHTTNTVRGLLCGRCNRAIGLMHDDTAILQNSIIYLEKTWQKSWLPEAQAHSGCLSVEN